MKRPIPLIPAPMMPIFKFVGSSMARLWKGTGGEVILLPMLMDCAYAGPGIRERDGNETRCSKNPT
jgi:hypothetical protein